MSTMAASDASGPCVLYPEAEVYVQSLEPIHKFHDIGTLQWLEKHAQLEKLNMQAAYEATNDVDESIKELLILEQKLAAVVEEAICIETWRDNIYHAFTSKREEETREFHTSTVTYMVLYHELTAVTLLETVCFHQECVLELGEAVADLVDYCCRAIRNLLAFDQKTSTASEGHEDENDTEHQQNKSAHTNELQNLQKMESKLRMDCGLKCISVIRSISNCLDSLPAGVVNAFLVSNDVPLLLTEILTSPPWFRESSKNGPEVYAHGSWRVVQDQTEVLSCEAQAWIALVQTLLGSKAAIRYELNSYRISQLRKLENLVHDALIDQIPALKSLKTTLVQMNFTQDPRVGFGAAKVPHCLVLEMGSGLEEKWKKAAESSSVEDFEHVFYPDASFISSFAQLMADVYDLDKLEALCDEPPVCAQCGQPASKRCSSCRGEWYCRRQCQVEHWGKHKQVCEVLKSVKSK